MAVRVEEQTAASANTLSENAHRSPSLHIDRARVTYRDVAAAAMPAGVILRCCRHDGQARLSARQAYDPAAPAYALCDHAMRARSTGGDGTVAKAHFNFPTIGRVVRLRRINSGLDAPVLNLRLGIGDDAACASHTLRDHPDGIVPSCGNVQRAVHGHRSA